jgi:hypothetical protein
MPVPQLDYTRSCSIANFSRQLFLRRPKETSVHSGWQCGTTVSCETDSRCRRWISRRPSEKGHYSSPCAPSIEKYQRGVPGNSLNDSLPRIHAFSSSPSCKTCSFDLVTHSQMMRTLQPLLSKHPMFCRSRSRLPLSFSRQNCSFDAGIFDNLQPGC